MGFFPFFGIPRRVRRYAFIALVVAGVYAGPRFVNDIYNYATGSTTTTTTVAP